jgi:ParB family chromosome partitioning protein
MTVREVEQAVRALAPPPEEASDPEDPASTLEPVPAPAARAPGLREPAVLELEELLSARLDTRVNVSIGSRRGRIVVEFADLDDLERIYRIITPPGATAGDDT